MISLFSILTVVTSVLSEETREEAEERVLAEAKAYVAKLSDDEFEAWVVSMEKMGRFLEIAKIMRVRWVLDRIESVLSPDFEYGIKFSKNYTDVVESTPLDRLESMATRKLSNQFKARYSYRYAKVIDHGKSSDDTREESSLDALYAYFYAIDYDRGPHDTTRTGSCREEPGGSFSRAFFYARDVDERPHDETRAACQKISLDYGNDYDRYFKDKFPSWYAERKL